jgi:serine/threonine-protein kinase RsbT
VELKRPEHLAHLRAAVRGVAETAGLSTEQTGGFLTAAHETAMNAVVHGGGGEARIGTLAGEPLTLVVLIRDNGPGIALDKIPERTLHGGVSGANSLGMGFSMVLDGVDRVHLRTTPSGTQILLEARREPLPPAWLDRPSAFRGVGGRRCRRRRHRGGEDRVKRTSGCRRRRRRPTGRPEQSRRGRA